jgi:sigma-B regulation protein RsbU (phosphoserine phosphatase)
MFATVFFGILDPGDGHLTYVNAGHDPPMVLCKEGIRARLTPTAPALGLAKGLRMEFGTLRLAPGETLFAYTDGVVDALGDDQPFGEARLAELLATPTAGAGLLLDALADALDAHVGVQEPFDDVTTVAVRRVPATALQ